MCDLPLQEDVVSPSGGWCELASRPDSGEHKFDPQLAEALAHLLGDVRGNVTVASFGDGPGTKFHPPKKLQML